MNFVYFDRPRKRVIRAATSGGGEKDAGKNPGAKKCARHRSSRKASALYNEISLAIATRVAVKLRCDARIFGNAARYKTRRGAGETLCAINAPAEYTKLLGREIWSGLKLMVRRAERRAKRK